MQGEKLYDWTHHCKRKREAAGGRGAEWVGKGHGNGEESERHLRPETLHNSSFAHTYNLTFLAALRFVTLFFRLHFALSSPCPSAHSHNPPRPIASVALPLFPPQTGLLAPVPLAFFSALPTDMHPPLSLRLLCPCALQHLLPPQASHLAPLPLNSLSSLPTDMHPRACPLWPCAPPSP